MASQRARFSAGAKWIALVVLVALVGCDSSSILPEEQALTGQAYLDTPLDGAKMAFETPSGVSVVSVYESTVHNGRFSERVSLDTPTEPGDVEWLSSYLPLIVKVTNGTRSAKAFDGTLLGYVTSFDSSNDLHVNILTTLIVKYALAQDISLDAAEVVVTGYLGLPSEVDPIQELNDPNTWSRFSPRRFMALAEANGGFDAFTDEIVENMIASQDAGFDFGVAGGAEGASIGSAIGSFVLGGIGDGLIAWGVSEAMGWILSEFGIEDPTAQALDQIKTELTQMNTTLNQIESDVQTLTTEVNQLMGLVNLEWSDLISKYDSMDMSTEESTIRNQNINITLNFPANSASVCTAAGNASATETAQQMLGTFPGTNYDIDQLLSNMYNDIIPGGVVGSNGALVDLTTELINEYNLGSDLLDCYNVLENYFGQLAAVQTQGLNLMIEALHQTQDPTGDSGLTVFQGDAVAYYNKFTGNMNDEVEVFLACVDRLVVNAMDVRSEIVESVAYLPPEAVTIYSRADFVACSLSTVQPSGLNIRLIGDPTHVAQWISDKSIQVNGSDPTIVSVNGNTSNGYAAKIPTTTPGVDYYLEWTTGNNVYTFTEQTKISVIKLNYPATAAGTFTVTSPTQSQTLSVAMLNNNYQPASSTDTVIIPYGSGVFYVHVLPQWRAGTTKKSDDTHDQWGVSCSWNTGPSSVSIDLNAGPEDLRWWNSCPLTYSGNVLTTISNAGSSTLKVNLNWNGTQTTTNDWGKRSNAPKTSGQQNLICQSTTQESTTNGKAMVFENVSLASNTSVDINYQAVMNIVSKSSIENKVEYGDNVDTYAFLSSLEIIPQK